MTAAFLPRSFSHNHASQTNRARTVRKVAVISQRPLPNSVNTAEDQRSHTSNINLGSYGQELQHRVRAAQEAQSDWYDTIANDADVQYNIRQEQIASAKNERDRLAEVERQEYERAQRQQLEVARARLAEEAERERFEGERIQRERAEAERQRVEGERVQAEAARAIQLMFEAEEQRWQIEEAERIRERLRECAVCLESLDMGMMNQLTCSHWYCQEHLRGGFFGTPYPTKLTSWCICKDAFEIAWASRDPFQCCQQVIPLDNMDEIISQPFRAQYNLWLLERTTPNPVYCSNRSCGVFLPPTQASGPDGIFCRECRASTCRHCRNASHPNTECAADVETQQARTLAARLGWKACPRCRNMVEKSSGCVHMTCRCGTEFCYRCSQLYRYCRGACK